MGAERGTSAGRWRDVLPGLGLTLGAAVALFTTLLLSSSASATALAVVTGAALGLVAGAATRALLHRDPQR